MWYKVFDSPMRTYRAICTCLFLCCFGGLFLATPASGFCPQPQPTVACEFLDSDAVFIGTVVSTQNTPAQGEFYDGWTYEINVQKMYRGPTDKTIEVFIENSDAASPLDNGKDYILFATEEWGRLTVDSCGNSALISKARKTIKELNHLRIPQDAEIEGQVVFLQRPFLTYTHVSNVHVVIRGTARIYTLTCDRNGWFHMHVHPGEYSADVQPIANWSIRPSGISTDDPDHFEAVRGHCTGLGFFAKADKNGP